MSNLLEKRIRNQLLTIASLFSLMACRALFLSANVPVFYAARRDVASNLCQRIVDATSQLARLAGNVIILMRFLSLAGLALTR